MKKKNNICNFCGKEIKSLSITGNDAIICEECASLANKIIQDNPVDDEPNVDIDPTPDADAEHGVDTDAKTEAVENRFGEKCRVKRYSYGSES